MKKIELSKGKYALVDDEDYEYLNQWSWYAEKRHGIWYAVRKPYNKRYAMHRIIMNVPKNKITDHIDGDGLNNQKSNLRICNHTQNMMNRKMNSNNTSGYKGVYLFFNKKQGYKRWCAYITANKKRTILGYFKNIKDASKAYEEAADRLFGEFKRKI